jgi:hypothetical protein
MISPHKKRPWIAAAGLVVAVSSSVQAQNLPREGVSGSCGCAGALQPALSALAGTLSLGIYC